MFRLEDGRRYLYQWDINQRIIVNTKAGTKVHFSTPDDANPNALTVESYEKEGRVYANIPNIFLQKAREITAYLYVENGDESHTEAAYSFMVRAREKPADYVYTETEVLNYSNLDARLKALEIFKIDTTITEDGKAADAGKLLYVDDAGNVTVLTLGNGLTIRDGRLCVTSATAVSAICGTAVCGTIICGEV